MAIKIRISGRDNLAESEVKLATLRKAIAKAATPSTGRIGAFEARVASQWDRYLFKEQWSALTVSPGLRLSDEAKLIAWGLQSWEKLSDETFQVSLPALLAIQFGATVMHERPQSALDPEDQRAFVIEQRHGILGGGSGSWRCLVEFDPQASLAPALNVAGDRSGRLLSLLRCFLSDMAVGAIGRRGQTQDTSHRRTALEFLLELHDNGWEHASAGRNLRTLRVEKHLYSNREQLRGKAASFVELSDFIESQGAVGTINLVEASVSDFGPGIVDGFLGSEAGAPYQSLPREELLDLLLHKKLSRKTADPNAGLGIANALNAAKAMYAFVSLRTGEFWYTFDGAREQREARLRPRPGRFPHVDGTHWQLLYPDLTA